MVVDRQLTVLGVRAEYAVDGREAFELWQRKHYDLVLTDCHMPNMDGFGLTRAIRGAERGTGRHVPIVALTANAMVGEAERCLNAGMDDYLAKPVTLAQIEEMLRRWTEASPSRDGAAPLRAACRTDEGQGEYRIPRRLAGVDVEDGVHRVMGNEVLFRDLLIDFAREYENVVEHIERNLGDGNLVEARSLAHGLKGLAANLSGTELQRCAGQVEAALKQGVGVSPAQMSALREAHQEFLGAARSLSAE